MNSHKKPGVTSGAPEWVSMSCSASGTRHIASGYNPVNVKFGGLSIRYDVKSN